MAGPSSRGEVRRQGLRRARWIAAGSAVGAAVVATGAVAVVNAAPSHANSGSTTQVRTPTGIDDGERGSAQPYTPQYQQPQSQTQQTPQYTPQVEPRTQSRGS